VANPDLGDKAPENEFMLPIVVMRPDPGCNCNCSCNKQRENNMKTCHELLLTEQQ